jgi:SAM-dependent methyltransferase
MKYAQNSCKKELTFINNSVSYNLIRDILMDINEKSKHWYACVYDQTFFDSEDDVKFLIDIIGKESKKVLEVCCGTGRILVPIAKANHIVTGFDMDEFMLERLSKKCTGMKNINYFKANAVDDDWGSGYDVIVLACNIMMNIVTNDFSIIPQKVFIEKAAKALKTGGYIYLDFNLRKDLDESKVSNDPEWVIFEGVDDKNIDGKFIMCSGGHYDKNTQIDYCNRRIELTLLNGEKEIYEYSFNKRIPKLDETIEWLKECNFEIKETYGNYMKEPISEKTNKAIIYAKKYR